MQALEGSSPLIVYIDIKSPYAFVAIKPILALEARLKAQFDWRPLTLNIPSYLGSAKKSKGNVVRSERSPAQWNNVRYAYRDTRRYAGLQGYMLKGTEKIWDSSIANIAILWVAQNARDRLAAYLDAVFPPFWRRELDIEDVAVIEAALRKADAPTKGFADFASGEGRAAHRGTSIAAEIDRTGGNLFDGDETLHGLMVRHLLFEILIDHIPRRFLPFRCKRFDTVFAQIGAHGAGANRVAGDTSHDGL